MKKYSFLPKEFDYRLKLKDANKAFKTSESDDEDGMGKAEAAKIKAYKKALAKAKADHDDDEDGDFDEKTFKKKFEKSYDDGSEDGSGVVQSELTKEEKSLLKKIKDTMNEEMKGLSNTLVSVKQFKSFEDKFKTLEKKAYKADNKDEYQNMVDEISRLSLEVKSFKETRVNLERGIAKGSISELLAKSAEKINGLKNKSLQSFELEYKTPNLEFKSETTEDNTSISNRDAYFTWHEGGMVGRLPVRRPFMRELIKKVATTTEYIKYIDQATAVRTAQNVALCGAITTTTSMTFAVNSVQVQKVKDMISICLDMMNDYTFVQGEIQNLLNSSLQLQIDSQLVTGTGSSPQLNSVKNSASTFSASASGANYSGLVPNAQLIDLISIGGAQIKAFGQQNMYFPDTVLMNPADVQSLKYLKDNLNNYIKNSQLFSSLFQDAQGRYYIDGMLLVENPIIAQNTMYIFDSKKMTLYARPGIGIEFAYENGTNFETDTVTLKVYERLNALIRNVDANAFLYFPDIAGGISAINNPGLK